MLILSTLVVGLIISIIIFNISDNENFEFISIFVGAFLSFTLVIAIIAIPLNHMGVKAGIDKFNSIQQTANRMRENGRIVESAAFQNKIADANQALVSAQYWNDTIFDLWIPDEVDELEPIE